jgi:dTDP-4-dehydrorhamnose 3,5-epimerase-like enzyme
MSEIIKIPTMCDQRGDLGIIEKLPGFDIKRVYFIYHTDGKLRGGHRHKKTRQVLVCLYGDCEVHCENELKESKVYYLNSPKKGLIIEPNDWHCMKNFSSNCILLVLASELYDKGDYIDEKY